MKTKKDIVIFGCGGFGREVKTLIDSINREEECFNFKGYFDDGVEIGTLINGFPVLGGIDKLNSYQNEISVVIAIGDPRIKKRIISKLTNTNIRFPKLIHPNVIVGDQDTVTIEEGCIITAGCILTCNILVEKHVIINLMCTVGHDTVIKRFCSFMPSVSISGEVVIEEEVYVGTGSKIINQLNVGYQTVIGAGAVVSKSLPERCTAVGIPAKPIKYHS